MKKFIHARNESTAAACNTSGDTQVSKSAHDLAAGPVWLSWILTRFQRRSIGNASCLPDLLRATFIQPFMQIAHQLTVWCDTHEPNAAYRLGAWEMHASGLARELGERRQAAANDSEAQNSSAWLARPERVAEHPERAGTLLARGSRERVARRPDPHLDKSDLLQH